jgi:hypothetical protein
VSEDRPDRPSPVPVPRRLGLALAAVPLLAGGIADGASLLHRAAPARAAAHLPAAAPSHRSQSDDADAIQARTVAIRGLLAQRGAAVRDHDAAAFLATVDPGSPAFRRRQRKLFDNVARVPFASWTYTFDPSKPMPPQAQARRYHAPTWSPADFALHYAFAGFDARPTSVAQYPTFVQRAGRWYLASLSDFASRGLVSARDLWDFGPVDVVRNDRALVLGHPGSLSLMRAVAAQVAMDVPRVDAVWGRRWSQRAVVLVPATQHELGVVVDDPGDLDQIAAVATAEVATGYGRPDPVGDRIGVNPANWPKLSPLGRQIVLTHELTHVATRAVTSTSTPTWLAEGFADYVGYLGSGVPTPFVAQDLGRAIQRSGLPHRLPSHSEFDGASRQLSEAYEGAWMACSLIAQRYGRHALVAFYRAVSKAALPPSISVTRALHSVLRTSTSAFVADWRAYLQQTLG